MYSISHSILFRNAHNTQLDFELEIRMQIFIVKHHGVGSYFIQQLLLPAVRCFHSTLADAFCSLGDRSWGSLRLSLTDTSFR